MITFVTSTIRAGAVFQGAVCCPVKRAFFTKP